MMRRQKVLGVVALSLAVTNLIALPDTLNAVAALRGGGAALIRVQRFGTKSLKQGLFFPAQA